MPARRSRNSLSKSNDNRYEDILRRIEQKRREEANAPALSDLTRTLDEVNALGFLERVRKRDLQSINCYGPKAFQSNRFAESLWAGAVLWHKPRGYYHFQTLGLLGIWVYPQADQVMVMLGEKDLAFKGPIFNPESYYHHLKRRFDMYYDGDASPTPASNQPYTAAYDAGERLAVRAILEAKIADWIQAHQ
jgi:hypothetical protein